MICQE